jgi:hypothetical protein
MFKTLYRCARTAARHETGPAAQSRLAYLEPLATGGATLHCLRANAGVLSRAATYMNLDDTSLVERAAVEKATTEWARVYRRELLPLGPSRLTGADPFQYRPLCYLTTLSESFPDSFTLLSHGGRFWTVHTARTANVRTR